MEKFVEQTLLYDFYGELLTKRQQEVYENVVLEDYSLSEVAEDLGISRQGVHDMIKRCDKILKDYEEKLHLVAKFMKIKDMAGEVHRLSGECMHTMDLTAIDEIRRLSAEITRTL